MTVIKKYMLCLLFLFCLTTGCQKTETHEKEIIQNKATTTASVSTAEEETKTAAVSSITTIQTQTAETAETKVSEPITETNEITSEAVIEETHAEETAEETYEQFSGILIDADCSDFDDPPAHDLPCMLMDSCRESGYGIDIQSDDGSWYFYPFDEKGQDIALNYLLSTQRMDNLYVTVTGVLTDNIISVINIEEKEYE